MSDCLSAARFLGFANDATGGSRKIRAKLINTARFVEVVMKELLKKPSERMGAYYVSVSQEVGSVGEVLWQKPYHDHDTPVGARRSIEIFSCRKCAFDSVKWL
jgi:hypothetical protein